MPLIEFEFINAAGQRERTERLFKMSDPIPDTINLGGRVATRVQISRTARMATQWDSYEPSDLPPVNAPLIEKK
jgi:hypothetical protein